MTFVGNLLRFIWERQLRTRSFLPSTVLSIASFVERKFYLIYSVETSVKHVHLLRWILLLVGIHHFAHFTLNYELCKIKLDSRRHGVTIPAAHGWSETYAYCEQANREWGKIQFFFFQHIPTTLCVDNRVFWCFSSINYFADFLSVAGIVSDYRNRQYFKRVSHKFPI